MWFMHQPKPGGRPGGRTQKVKGSVYLLTCNVYISIL